MTTSRADFDAALVGHRVIPVVRELFADGETPVGVFRKLAGQRAGAFLLESAEPGGIWSRYSFIGVHSFGVLTEDAGRTLWQAAPEGPSLGTLTATGLDDTALAALPTLKALEHLHQRWVTPRIPGLPSLTGGLVGFIGWEAVRQLEHLPHQPPADYRVPELAFNFVADLVVLDHLHGTVLLVANVLNIATEQLEPPTAGESGAAYAGGGGTSTVQVSGIVSGVTDSAHLGASSSHADTLWADAQARLDALESALDQPLTAQLAPVMSDVPTDATGRTERDDFLAVVDKAKEHIVAGDVFQLVLSQRFERPSIAPPLDVYRVLRTLNPSPYMYLLQMVRPDGEPYTVVGSSPEALVKVTDGRTYMHPIAGSRPRGATPEADEALSAELLADEKERSEHLMLVDLARNDLAKVCRAGSVDVTEFMRVERFSHIMHIVSSVEGDLDNEYGPVDVFRATFPAGTLSGAPKPRALQLIDQYEPTQRGIYSGVVGYFDFAGDADLAIAIRTATLLEGRAYVQAGAGIVADSDPATEDTESRNKAAAPLRAVAIADAMVRAREARDKTGGGNTSPSDTASSTGKTATIPGDTASASDGANGNFPESESASATAVRA